MYNYFYYNTTIMKYAIQLRTNGSVLDYSDSLEEIQQIMASSSHNLEIVDTTTASVIKVTYTELGGPNGYGVPKEGEVIPVDGYGVDFTVGTVNEVTNTFVLTLGKFTDEAYGVELPAYVREELIATLKGEW